MEVRFYSEAEDNLLKYAVVISKHKGKWVYCKHRERDTFEIPGGHREQGEDILSAAKRELEEETGAKEYVISPVCVYSVYRKSEDTETFGMLFFAEIESFFGELHSEIESIHLFEEIPNELTYPQIQPYLFKEYLRRTKN